ncbi:MAG: hypothetical protein ABIB71_03520 [Candidatus Woesearchaeota archaeon]
MKQKRRPFLSQVVGNLAKVGLGMYVGYMDGKGIPLDPTMKYLILAAPATVTAATISIGMSFAKDSVSKALNSSDLEQKLEKELGKEEAEKEMERMQDFVENASIAKETALGAGITALKTGIGYAAGYFLAPII